MDAPSEKTMQIQINTDSNIEARERFLVHVRGVVEGALRFNGHITRVEVHLSDGISHKSGHVKRCMMEARLEHHRPIAVTHQAASLDQAVEHAAGKLRRSLESILEQQRECLRR
jgi:hypothetical protein